MPGVQTRLNAEEEQALLRLLREANTLSAGPEGEAFEREFAAFTGAADAVAVCSCTAALELAAVLSGVGPGDEVILPAHTFVSSAVPFARTGATLRWTDLDPDTRLISPASVASLVTPRTRVVVVVHLYGLSADMDALMAIAREQGLMVAEDCAQAPGARYKGKRVGSFGDFGCFSFHDLIDLLYRKYRVKCIVQYWPLYRSELFRSLGHGEADVPETDRFFDNMISFPWWSDMADEVLDDMAERTRSALAELRAGSAE